MRRFIILNPWSGSGRTARLADVIIDSLRSVAVDYCITDHCGECREAALRAANFDGLIAVGGDGTICEVVRGMDITRQTLAFIPTGTGNSLGRDFGLKTLEESLACARTGKIKTIDLLKVSFTTISGKTEEWYSASTISIGYAARCTAMANRCLKKLGKFCYPLASVLCAVPMQRLRMTLAYAREEAQVKSLSGIMIGNTRHAANFEAFPMAVIDDGVFDVMELDTGFMGQSLHNASVLSRLHFYKPAGMRQTSSLRMTLEKPHLLMIDGEIITDVIDVSVAIAPASLRCYSPR